MSLFPGNSVEATQDLQHKWPGGMEAIGQPLFYNTGTNHKVNMISTDTYLDQALRRTWGAYRNILQT